MMFGLGSFNLINEFERASNKPNAEQLASSSTRLQPYLWPRVIKIVGETSLGVSRVETNLDPNRGE